MSSKFLLTALAGVAAVAVIAAPQDPSFEFPAAKHAGFDSPAQDSFQKTQAAERVSVTFRNAAVREVLDWLKDQGVSFVIGDDQVNKDSHVSVNVVNQPVETVMHALAGAWDGHWEKQNDIWVFHKGRDFLGETTRGFGSDAFISRGTTAPAQVDPGARKVLTRPDQSSATFSFTQGGHGSTASVAPGAPGQERISTRVLSGTAPVAGGYRIVAPGQSVTIVQGNGDHRLLPPTPMSKEQEAALQKALQNVNDPKAWEEFAKSWERWAKEYEKNYQDFEQNLKGKDFNFRFNDQQVKELEKQAEEMAKQGELLKKGMAPGKGFTWDGNMIKALDEKQLAEIRKQAAQMAKDAQNWSRETAPMIRPWSFENAAPAAKGGRVGSRFASPEVNTGLSTHNLKAIFDLLTPTQSIKLKRLGYINYSDLNSKQRTLLGVITDDSWTISFKSDKVNITIKSDH